RRSDYRWNFDATATQNSNNHRAAEWFGYFGKFADVYSNRERNVRHAGELEREWSERRQRHVRNDQRKWAVYGTGGFAAANFGTDHRDESRRFDKVRKSHSDDH